MARVYGETTVGFEGRKDHVAVFVKPNQSVCIIDSTMKQGIRKDNGKRWCRWEDVQSYGFFRTSAGNIVPYRKLGKRWDGRNAYMSFAAIEDKPEWHKEKPYEVVFKEYLAKELGVTKFGDVYPFAEAKEFSYRKMSPTTRNFYRAENAIDFTLTAFGKTRYRKDLVKAIATTKYDFSISIAHAFRGLVPVDWLVNFLRFEYGFPNVHEAYTNFRGLRDIIKQIDPRSYRGLLSTELTAGDLFELQDVLSTYRARNNPAMQHRPLEIPPNRFRTWRELHDGIIGHRRLRDWQIPEEHQGEIKLTKLAEKLDGLELLNGMKIIVPKHTKELVEYGQIMKNCIGVYGRQAMEGSSTFAAVSNDGKMIANIQVTANNTLTQLLGKCNQPLPVMQRQIIELALINNGVNIPGNYWGSGELW